MRGYVDYGSEMFFTRCGRCKQILTLRELEQEREVKEWVDEFRCNICTETNKREGK